MPSKTPRSTVPAVCCCLAGGLLSSSCCVIQLLLNYTSIGCAGFSILTPYRHYFRLLTGSFLTYLLITQGINKRTLTTTLISIFLMASQYLLGAQNRGSLSSSIHQLLTQYKLLPSGLASGLISPQQQQLRAAAQRIVLAVRGMRCEACAARLRGSLAALEGVDGCTVHFTTGQVEVWSNSSSAVQQEVLLEAVRATDDSYDVRIDSKECYNAADQAVPCPSEPADVVEQR